MRAEEPARCGGDQGRSIARRCGAGTVDGDGRRRRRRRRQLAGHVQRRPAEYGGGRGDRSQRRPARRRGTGRAGDALRQAGRRQALSVRRPAGARRRQDVGRRLGSAGSGAHRQLGARPLGPRAVRPRRGSRRRHLRAGGFRVRAAVDRGARRQELVPGHRGRPPGGSWPGRPSAAETRARAAGRNASCASASATTRTS